MKKFLAFVIGTVLLAGGASLAANQLAGQTSVQTLQSDSGTSAAVPVQQTVADAQNRNALTYCGQEVLAGLNQPARDIGSSSKGDGIESSSYDRTSFAHLLVNGLENGEYIYVTYTSGSRNDIGCKFGRAADSD